MPDTALPQKRNFFKAILVTSLLVALLDIIAAVLNYYVNNHAFPNKIFQYIASAAIGNDAYSGGVATSLLGAAFHVLIAFAFTFFFFILYPKFKILSKNKFIVGLIYGIIIWLIMNLIILRITRLPFAGFKVKQVVIAMSILMICVGLPISLMASKYFGGVVKKPV